MAQLIEALPYKPEDRGFDSRWCHWNFSLSSFRPHYDPGVDSASNRNEYQEYFLGGKGGRCVGLTTLPTSCADCLEIWEPQPPGKPQGLSRPVMGLLYLFTSFSMIKTNLLLHVLPVQGKICCLFEQDKKHVV